MKEQHDLMRPMVQRCSLSNKYYDSFLQQYEKSTGQTKRKITRAFKNLVEKEYKDLLNARKQMHINEDMWENYDLLGLDDLAEVKIWKKAVHAFRKALGEIRKIKDAKEKVPTETGSTNSECVN